MIMRCLCVSRHANASTFLLEVRRGEPVCGVSGHLLLILLLGLGRSVFRQAASRHQRRPGWAPGWWPCWSCLQPLCTLPTCAVVVGSCSITHVDCVNNMLFASQHSVPVHSATVHHPHSSKANLARCHCSATCTAQLAAGSTVTQKRPQRRQALLLPRQLFQLQGTLQFKVWLVSINPQPHRQSHTPDRKPFLTAKPSPSQDSSPRACRYPAQQSPSLATVSQAILAACASTPHTSQECCDSVTLSDSQTQWPAFDHCCCPRGLHTANLHCGCGAAGALAGGLDTTDA